MSQGRPRMIFTVGPSSAWNLISSSHRLPILSFTRGDSNLTYPRPTAFHWCFDWGAPGHAVGGAGVNDLRGLWRWNCPRSPSQPGQRLKRTRAEAETEWAGVNSWTESKQRKLGNYRVDLESTHRWTWGSDEIICRSTVEAQPSRQSAGTFVAGETRRVQLHGFWYWGTVGGTGWWASSVVWQANKRCWEIRLFFRLKFSNPTESSYIAIWAWILVSNPCR